MVGGCASAVAISGAFANSFFPVSTAWIKVKYTGESAFVCRSTSLEVCSNRVDDIRACRIVVSDILQATNAYTNSNCSVFMKDSGHGEGVFNPPPTIIEVPEYEDELP
jgi:hypothetical protein